jgi:hypothetical protein
MNTSLSNVRFSPKIDYFTISTTHRVSRAQIDRFEGKAIYPRSMANTALTIHDPTKSDIELAASYYPHSSLTEVEIAIDIRPRSASTQEEHLCALTEIKSEWIAKCLTPALPAPSQGGFRAAYLPLGSHGYPQRFNSRVPGLSEQLLYVHRTHPIQVKVYHKHLDQRKALSRDERSIRLEVRLSGEGLRRHGLDQPLDLLGFPYRKALMPYLRHAKGVELRERRARPPSEVIALARKTIERHHADRWERYGVGAFEEGGCSDHSDVKRRRFTEMNDRLGQALTRLEQTLRNENRAQWRSSRAIKP